MKFSKYMANTFLDSGNDSFHSHSSFCPSAFPVVTLIIGVGKKLVSKFIVTLLFMIPPQTSINIKKDVVQNYQ